MPYPEHLLEQAKHLAKRELKRPRQASLRRSVSTAYYALFHLLVSEATQNWKRAGQRAQLARLFEHGRMRSASEKQRATLALYFKTNPGPCRELEICRRLHLVANTFFESQQQRHVADYDGSRTWMRIEVITQIDLVDSAFQSWREIREEDAAQGYLISLLGVSRGSV
jgi:hypothetical protein